MRRILLALVAAIACAPALAANCYITEFTSSTTQSGFPYQAAVEPALAESVVAIGSSTQSSAFNAQTALVRITCTAAANIEFGTNPTATTSKTYMPSGAIEYFVVPRGATYKVAVITGGS